jgi:subtilisin family serine protease
VRDVIAAIEGGGVGAAVQPNYTFGLSQDQKVQVASLGDPAQYIVDKLQLGAVHRISKGDHVVVALIDSKIDTEQPDIAGAVTDEFDAGCGADTAPDPHGTGMAGAIASHLNLLGVAPDAKLIAICAFGGHGTPESSSVKIIKGLDYAIQHGAKIVNMSFAGPRDPAVAQELQIAREKGIVLIGAAGNDGPNSPPLYPGADPNVIAVTATDENDRVFRGANQGEYVALAAPGVDILVPAPHSGVQFTTGTSVATAHVSGVAALLMSEKPSLSPEQVRSILTSTAKHYAAKGSERKSGAGVIDPLKALRLKPLS